MKNEMPSRVSAGARGFTLLEIMVVVIIIGIIVTLAILSLGDSGARRLDEEAYRFSSLIRLAADEAVLQGREIGLAVKRESYSFHVFDDQLRQWTPLATELVFRERKLSDGIEMELRLDDQEFVLPLSEEEEEASGTLPQILLLSSGEITAFDLAFELKDVKKQVVLRSQGNGDIETLAAHEI
ncbi:MAG: type II secretion system minor pseudopilin GspH [Gammaproteobacteria bacterium]|nr:type II secretion system minor pseudopilin GspH [Gammaproteobacteria bacterium]